MKVQLIIDAKGPNPAYSAEADVAAKQAGEAYNVPRDVTYPAGTVLDHPDAWLHCIHGHLNKPPIAIPVDDEARTKYEQWLKQRPDQIAAVAAVLNQGPSGTGVKRNQEARFHKALRWAYREELARFYPDDFPISAAEEPGNAGVRKATKDG